MKAHDPLAVDRVNGDSSRWLSLAGLALLVACGGGGGATGTTPFGDGSGTTPLGSGAGTPPFGAGSGTGGLTGDGPRPTADAAVVVSDDAIQGTVINSRTGIPLSGATVSFAGTTLTTDSNGAYGQQTAAAASRVLFEPVPAMTLMRPREICTTSEITRSCSS